MINNSLYIVVLQRTTHNIVNVDEVMGDKNTLPYELTYSAAE
jgi:hypothetical protein